MLTELNNDLDKKLISSEVLLNNFVVINEHDRKSAIYTDIRHFPFYYHLGKYLKPKSMLDLSLGLGFYSGCFLKSCKTVENFVGFNSKGLNENFALKNIRRTYKKHISIHIGGLYDKEFPKSLGFDVILINESYDFTIIKDYLAFAWNILNDDGYIIINHIRGNKAFDDFVKCNNRIPEVFDTRYGVGIVQK